MGASLGGPDENASSVVDKKDFRMKCLIFLVRYIDKMYDFVLEGELLWKVFWKKVVWKFAKLSIQGHCGGEKRNEN